MTMEECIAAMIAVFLGGFVVPMLLNFILK